MRTVRNFPSIRSRPWKSITPALAASTGKTSRARKAPGRNLSVIPARVLSQIVDAPIKGNPRGSGECYMLQKLQGGNTSRPLAPPGFFPVGFSVIVWRQVCAIKHAPMAGPAGVTTASQGSFISKWGTPFFMALAFFQAGPNRLTCRGGPEVHGETTVVEVDNVIPGNGDSVIRILSGVQGGRESSFVLYAAGKSQIVNLDGITGVLGFLSDTLQVGLANNIDFHFYVLNTKAKPTFPATLRFTGGFPTWGECKYKLTFWDFGGTNLAILNLICHTKIYRF